MLCIILLLKLKIFSNVTKLLPSGHSASNLQQILQVSVMFCILMFQEPEADRNPLDHDEL